LVPSDRAPGDLEEPEDHCGRGGVPVPLCECGEAAKVREQESPVGGCGRTDASVLDHLPQMVVVVHADEEHAQRNFGGMGAPIQGSGRRLRCRLVDSEEGREMNLSSKVRGAAVLVALALALGACNPPLAGTSAGPTSQLTSPPGAEAVVLWLAPQDAMGLAVKAGLEPAPQEYTDHHAHAHLDVFLDGKPVLIPAGIGIDIDSPDVTRFDEPDGSITYGGIEVCGAPCISPLHTHAESGILHTESQATESHTLGEFFIEWDVTLSESCVGEHCDEPIAVYVNGERYTGEAAAIELTDLKQIAIVIGTPPAVIPATADFSRP
jgi:hypothetical protein